MTQLVTLIIGLVILLAFRDDIAGGAAGCFDHIVAVEGGDASPPAAPAVAPTPASTPAAAGSAEAPGPRSTRVEVKVMRLDRPAGVVDAAESDADLGPDAASPAEDAVIGEALLAPE